MNEKELVEIILFDNSIKGKKYQKNFTELADEILTTPITIESVECPDCKGEGEFLQQVCGEVSMRPCYKCHTAGKLPAKTFTIKEAIEEKLK